MRDLDVIIPARNEIFAQRTIEDVLANSVEDTGVCLVLDGYWPAPPILDHPKVTVVHVTEPIGQRAAVNLGARISQAKYIMKLDAHCALSPGFDRILMEDCQPDWTMVPSMYNLHAFDWECQSCKQREYQGTKPEMCVLCGSSDFRMAVVWKPRGNKITYSWRFDSDLNFQYWRNHHRLPQWRDEPLIETMTCIGACFFMERERFSGWGGMDEGHGSWGNFGTELACKSWLSGGKMITSRRVWFAHLFRTGNFKGSGWRGSSFPYEIPQEAIDHAKAYSRDLWQHSRWPKQLYPLSWLVQRFAPVPGWTDDDIDKVSFYGTRPDCL